MTTRNEFRCHRSGLSLPDEVYRGVHCAARVEDGSSCVVCSFRVFHAHFHLLCESALSLALHHFVLFFIFRVSCQQCHRGEDLTEKSDLERGRQETRLDS